MTASDWQKMLKQFTKKPAKQKKYIKHNKPKERKFGLAFKKCENCGRYGSHVGQYALHLCRQCFREMAVDMGFKKYQ